MALTQISTGGVKNDAVTAGKIPANAVGSSEIADDAVGTAQIADDGVVQAAVADEAIDEARLQISNAGSNGQFLSKQSGNTGGLTWATPTDTVYTHPNHSGEVTSSADGATTIASNIVDEDNLKISNAGTNGQFLQKQSGNTGGLTWADVTIPPAGNTFTAVADGAIATNKPVCCVSSGKVAEIKETTTQRSTLVSSVTWGDTTTTEKLQDHRHMLAFDPDNDIILQAYVQNDSPYRLRSQIWKKHASSAGGLAQQGSVADITSVQAEEVDMCWLSSNRFVVVFRDQTNSKSMIKVGTLGNLSGTPTISWGSDYDLDGQGARDYRAHKVVKIGANRVAILCKAHSGSNRWTNDKAGVIVGDITNDDEWTYRNALILSSTDLATNGYYDTTIKYNSTDDLCLCTMNFSSTSSIIAIKVASGTSATITSTTSATQLYSSASKWHTTVWHPGSNTFVLAYRENSAGDTHYTRATVNSSSLAISKGATYGLSDNTSNGLCLAVSELGGLYLIYLNNNNLYHRFDHDYNGGNPGWSNESSALYSSLNGKIEWINQQSGVVSADYDKYLYISFMQSGHGGTYQRYGHIGSIPTTADTSNLSTSGNYPVGWVDSAYSDGNTVTVKTVGNTQTGFSGLTPGTKYYIKGDGTIATSADSALNAVWGSNKPIAGTAIKSDTLLISSPHSQ